jgi:hypothetical protein
MNMDRIKLAEYLWSATAIVVFFVGAWQLDLLAAPAFWHTEYFVETIEQPFLLPFNIPIHKQHAYVLFFGLMEIAFLMLMFSPMKIIGFIRKAIARVKNQKKKVSLKDEKEGR